MNDLENVKWGEFRIGEIFEITSTKNGIDKNKLNGKAGTLPYITRTDKRNGIDDFIAIQKGQAINDGGVITIGLDTQTIFYQHNPFYTGQNIQILRNENLNRWIAHFVIVTLQKLMKNFNWGGNGATLTRLRRSKILLPIDPDGKPNWAFMDSYMRIIEKRKLQTIITHFSNKLNMQGGGDNTKIQSLQQRIFIEEGLMKIAKENFDLEQIEWGEFRISELFKNSHGKRLVEKQRIEGNIPLLTAGESNNGVASFISNKEMRTHRDFISIDMFGNAFYHSYKATGDDNIYFFANNEIHYLAKLFVVACINRQKSKYSYGKQFRQANADNARILLPLDSKGKPNWAFMESYMKAIETKHLKTILSYYTHKLQRGGA